MGNVQSYGAASFAVCSVYLVVHIYCSHKVLKTNVLTSDKLPSFSYLYIKYVFRALTRRTGHLHTTKTKRNEAVYTILKCRLETLVLRRFCSAGGYGWDYPDTEYRDIPLCFPEVLCGRLMLMLLTDENFRLSPAGLVRVCQSLKTLQPIDELKKGPFTLQVRVLVYRQVDAGVEVDICLSATSRSGCPVWESVLTLLSKNKLHRASRGSTKTHSESQRDEPVPENMKQGELRVPWSPRLQCVWSLSDCSLYRLLSLPARLFGRRSHTAPGLWMLSVCLAEIEKHKGVEVITAPVNVTARFEEPLLVPDIQVEEESVSAAALEISGTHSGSSHLCHVILITETSGEQGSAVEGLSK
ncbi:uncharacterized protein si:ch211-12e13.1 isoform X2 [Seriola aureovittata]|uniref:uncharacterized protein si:ch211-12e13.1 isoform X2 n=1 Tax=Seriola aureovittata TaxID=2871759 RepID=UPI0024BDE746|nr:uncharacterized protein si:ch211-12e13.1 isoform X2 [Seriola aureovittata]